MGYPAVGPSAQIQRYSGPQHPVVTHNERPRVSASACDLRRVGQQLLHVGRRESRELGSRSPQVTPAELERKVIGELVANVETSAEAAPLDVACHDLIAVGLKVVGDIAGTERARHVAENAAEVPVGTWLLLPVGRGRGARE